MENNELETKVESTEAPKEVKIEFTPEQHKEIDRIVAKNLTAKEQEWNTKLTTKEQELNKLISERDEKIKSLSSLEVENQKLKESQTILGTAKVEVSAPVKNDDIIPDFVKRRDGIK